MQPPISLGTVLQNRYLIKQILGQGGFGRTYLAEDQGRFQELCAIKELIPMTTEPAAWEKSQELFQREAAILYQIQHPQIPQFRERFEHEQRLFLVQDYVEGKTYRRLLEDHQAINSKFTESEVLKLLRSLLPVLDYIHGRGIIHRDISPENIMLRDRDQQPVLIDFGVVKELATKLQSPNQTGAATYVGKLGFSPAEQMQTGQAYPSSDLYSLAVTAIVLLTGKEPQDLFDENQLAWNWQKWVAVSPKMAMVLTKMLSYRPGDRYQNAMEVLEALRSIESGNTPVVNNPQSNVQTVAVGHRPDPVTPSTPQRPDAVIPPPATRSILDNPLAVAAITLGVIIFAGFGSWIIVRSIRTQSQADNQPVAPQTFASPLVTAGTPTPKLTESTEPTEEPTQTPTSTPTQAPVIKIKRLTFGASNIAKVDDTIRANQVIRYTFRGKVEQQITAALSQESGVALTVLAPNGKPVETTAQGVTFYQGILPVTGRYTVELSLNPGVNESDFSLNVGLEDLLTPSPTPRETTAEPIPIETPTPTTEPIPTETAIPEPIITPDGTISTPGTGQ
ncbi:serine/threonine-protein kinase [Calothrix sp. 336/3]|uniref:serine/threonine-protein kinase n=1 Tax=Calothrix sp. 336/3 TaxID=1337936 RepID=UPI0004E3D65D|nr:serine/threonine-protein kinase [Calothrix sp. 336/3]AKG22320.1 serine/threonine protein kinase [Calothrix sp. 336/3]